MDSEPRSVQPEGEQDLMRRIFGEPKPRTRQQTAAMWLRLVRSTVVALLGAAMIYGLALLVIAAVVFLMPSCEGDGPPWNDSDGRETYNGYF